MLLTTLVRFNIYILKLIKSRLVIVKKKSSLKMIYMRKFKRVPAIVFYFEINNPESEYHTA